MSRLTLVVFLLAASSCKKEEPIPVAPQIIFTRISASTVEQFNNSITVEFQYEDHQGDLGEPDPDNYSLRIKDSRLLNFDWYHIPPMTPDLQELHIKGYYSVQLPVLFILGNGSQETASFTLQLRDRAGHWSNIIATPNVLIVDSL